MKSPSSLVMRGVLREGNNPVAGGGFAVLRLVIEPDEEARKKIRKQFCNEAILWRQLKHPNILPLLGVNAELFNPSFCLISPWMANKDIISYLKQNFKHSRHEVVSTAFRSF
ncbi:hypothetical protein BT96DRAFT_842157 [Gymnopus androsaceus JB14]|uniref:Serine-threonine/tyrosine-protein kinase catalytic domain-containing protein n=1 Tax=Gymnopus androsaceus JB14 TaxID=1447944 RepID=A0A6A4GGG5_9AGAR|nr:hypothetical protein BT96DRAFT_842157 [Gymnopus androsaceus JB14]